MPAAGFESGPVRLRLWRAVEAQHVVSTMALVDTREEQLLLEQLIDASKPAVPPAAQGLHYLLYTPFRYPPPAYGSRFRRPTDPGVFYGADELRTACAELGYWRWRFLVESPAVDRLKPAAQTVFQVAVAGTGVDLRTGRLAQRQQQWTDPVDYGACQALASGARAAGVAVIRYQSVRDPEHGGCGAVLTPTAFQVAEPLAQETWFLGVTRERVRWSRERLLGEASGYEFEAAAWTAPGPS
jgi:RES domain